MRLTMGKISQNRNSTGSRAAGARKNSAKITMVQGRRRLRLRKKKKTKSLWYNKKNTLKKKVQKTVFSTSFSFLR